ncbi:TM2 domain-containing protein [Neotamlana laminarinivorans]|uniref:TM2 domain-containing protein n=1 Tax=Neotamlana laminarinivorans TaxID=2883124 RepID=A0A9X1L2X2_9FLAO|nr:TM2 domain-containing protein [Tamlana laminarinivorans]MCB4798059.1 TM2 domain-containing protein [Tamlana laminarinivorans]
MSDEKNLSNDLNEMLDDAKEGAKEFANDAKETAAEFANNAEETFNEVTGENKKVLAGVLAIILGALGVHKFILGYNKEGIIMLAISVITCGIGASVIGLIGLIEGIIYLTKSDAEFYATYQLGKKGWF